MPKFQEVVSLYFGSYCEVNLDVCRASLVMCRLFILMCCSVSRILLFIVCFFVLLTCFKRSVLYFQHDLADAELKIYLSNEKKEKSKLEQLKATLEKTSEKLIERRK